MQRSASGFQVPFALSLSKGSPFSLPSTEKKEGEGFDELSPNGFGGFVGSGILWDE